MGDVVRIVGRPMRSAPRDEEARAFLFCPERGGWISAVRHEGRWMDFCTLTVDLTDYATHWEPVFPDPSDAP